MPVYTDRRETTNLQYNNIRIEKKLLQNVPSTGTVENNFRTHKSCPRREKGVFPANHLALVDISNSKQQG